MLKFWNRRRRGRVSVKYYHIQITYYVQQYEMRTVFPKLVVTSDSIPCVSSLTPIKQRKIHLFQLTHPAQTKIFSDSRCHLNYILFLGLLCLVDLHVSKFP